MKWRSSFVMVVLTSVIAPVVVSAAVIHVTLHKPPPGRYGIEDLWKATVTSDTACDAWFEGFVFEATHGEVFHVTTKPFPLHRGTKVYGYHDVTIDKTQTAPGYEMFVTRVGHLPAGDYSFELILRPFGVGDSFEFPVKSMGPPRLIAPGEGDTVKVKYPTFSWTPPAPMPAGGVTYELKLVEMRPGQSAEEALGANPVWFEKKDIRTTSLTYPTSARAIETEDMPPHEAYAWRVTAQTRDGAASRSEARSFAVIELLPPEVPELWISLEPEDTVFSGVVVYAALRKGGPPREVRFYASKDSLEWDQFGCDTSATNGWSGVWNTWQLADTIWPTRYYIKAEAVNRQSAKAERAVPVMVRR